MKKQEKRREAKFDWHKSKLDLASKHLRWFDKSKGIPTYTYSGCWLVRHNIFCYLNTFNFVKSSATLMSNLDSLVKCTIIKRWFYDELTKWDWVDYSDGRKRLNEFSSHLLCFLLCRACKTGFGVWHLLRCACKTGSGICSLDLWPGSPVFLLPRNQDSKSHFDLGSGIWTNTLNFTIM